MITLMKPTKKPHYNVHLVYLPIIHKGSTFFFFLRIIEEKTLGNGDVDLQKNAENSMYRLGIPGAIILGG